MWAKQGVSEQVWFVPKTAGGGWGSGSSAIPGKLCNFCFHLSLEAVFPADKQPQNCFIINIGSPTQHIYIPIWKIILPIWQNMNVRELHSQSPNWLVNWENLGVQSKLIFKDPNFQSRPWIGKNWEVQLEQHSKIPVFNLFVNWEKIGSKAKDQDSKVPILNL